MTARGLTGFYVARCLAERSCEETPGRESSPLYRPWVAQHGHEFLWMSGEVKSIAPGGNARRAGERVCYMKGAPLDSFPHCDICTGSTWR